MGDALQSHPLDGPILAVAQTVVIVWEEIARQGRVRHFDTQSIVNPVGVKRQLFGWSDVGSEEIILFVALYSLGTIYVTQSLTGSEIE